MNKIKTILASLLLAGGLITQAQAGTTVAGNHSFNWGCSEFYFYPVDGGTFVAFNLYGIGKWELFGKNDAGDYVLVDRGEIVPSGSEVIEIVPNNRLFLRILGPDGWPLPNGDIFALPPTDR